MIFAGLKVILQVVLFAMFFYMYGLPAWEKLNKQSTIVIKTKEDRNGIQAPSITISARSPVTGSGWKRTVENTKPDDVLLHHAKTSLLLRNVWTQSPSRGKVSSWMQYNRCPL